MCCDPFLETKKGIATANPSYVQWGFLLISYAFSIPDLPTDANFCRVFSAGKKRTGKFCLFFSSNMEILFRTLSVIQILHDI